MEKDIAPYTGKQVMIAELLRYEKEYLGSKHFNYEEAERQLLSIEEKHYHYLQQGGNEFAEDFGKRVREEDLKALAETIEGYKEKIQECESKKLDFREHLKKIDESESPRKVEELNDLISDAENEIKHCKVKLKISEDMKMGVENGEFPLTQHLKEYSKKIDEKKRGVQRRFKYARWIVKFLFVVAAYMLGKELTKNEPCDGTAPFVILAFYFVLDCIVDYLQGYFLNILMKRLLKFEVRNTINRIEEQVGQSPL
ncbi:MAG: hypothetical protein E6Q36_04945 [Chryseobacterium sp.]|nr:MAG: hypothetical protein E6Q36_04945 [Chryseobacterium sp.]